MKKFQLNRIFGIAVFVAFCVSQAWAQSEHVVVKGDTLSSISKEVYGTTSKWKIIYEANKDVIKNKGLIRVGAKLKIPPAEIETPKVTQQAPADSKPQPQPAKAEEVSKEAKLTFLYFNDFHGMLEPKTEKKVEKDVEVAGIARLTGMIRLVQKENAAKNIPTFLMNAGDFLQGGLLSNHFAGKIESDIYNKIGMSYYSVGNHEFDFGMDNFRKLISSVKASCVTTNIFLKSEGKYVGQPQLIRIKGIVIGIAGLLTTDDFNEGKISSGVLKEIVAEDAFEKAPKAVADLKSKGADVIVFLTHLGFGKDKKLAKAVRGIDIIIGGDSHDRIELEKVDNTYIVQTGDKGNYLGKMDITVREKKLAAVEAKLIAMDDQVKPDDEISEILTKYQKELADKGYNQVIAQNDCALEGEKTIIRSKETNFGNLITDILKDRFKTDAAVMNSGGIRSSIGKGAITLGDIHKAMPFPNAVHVLTLSGKELSEVLKHSVTHRNKGAFLQVSGLSFKIDPRISEIIGDIQVNGQKLAENKMYKIAMSSYIADGDDGYTMLKSIPDDRRQKADFNIAQVVIDYIKENHGKKSKPVSYCKSEERIVVSE